MRFEKYPKHINIVKHGERGTKFFIIIKGRVSVHVPLKLDQEMTQIEFFQFLREHYK